MNINLEIEILVLALLLIASIVSIIVRRIRIPYTAALVLAGLLISYRSGVEVELTSKLILSLFLPPLLFEAAFHLSINELRRNMRTILLLAVPGVILSTLLVGGVVALGAGISLTVGLVFGALIAATDPVAVVAIFRKMGAPKRLEVLLEGESLFNDGTAVVLFNLAVGAVVSGDFNLVDGIVDFVRVSGGGILIGLALGWAISRLIALIQDYLTVTTLTTVLAFGSYLVAEQFHFSGVLAVVTAGLMAGNIGEREMSPSARIIVVNFWEFTAFLTNSAVFLLIGLQPDLKRLFTNWEPILWAIGAVLLSRAINIYLISRLASKLPTRWRHVLFWGGLRGAIALALALSLPETIGPGRSTVVVMTLGVVLFSTLGQGISMDWLVHKLKIVTRSDQEFEYESRQARAIAARAGLDHLNSLHNDGLISSHTWELLQPIMEERLKVLTLGVQRILHSTPELEVQEFLTAQREALRAQRSTLAHLRREGILSEVGYERLLTEIDLALQSTDETWARQTLGGHVAPDVDQFLMAVVQARDLENATNGLILHAIPSTIIQSTGGMLRQRNHVLLVGVTDEKLEPAVAALQSSTEHRVEFVPVAETPTEGIEDVPAALADPRRVTIHGATILLFDVERYEVI